MDTSVNAIWILLEDNNYFTRDELQLITDMFGYKIETLDLAVSCRYGYRTALQFLSEEME